MPGELDITLLKGVRRCGHPTCRLVLDKDNKCPLGHEQRICSSCHHPMLKEVSEWRCHNCGSTSRE